MLRAVRAGEVSEHNRIRGGDPEKAEGSHLVDVSVAQGLEVGRTCSVRRASGYAGPSLLAVTLPSVLPRWVAHIPDMLTLRVLACRRELCGRVHPGVVVGDVW